MCVGVTSTTGPQLRHALEVSQVVKARSDVPVVWGGIHATLLPEQTLERPEIDFVVQGEGERTFEELVAALERGGAVGDIAGVWRKEAGGSSAARPGRSSTSTPSRRSSTTSSTWRSTRARCSA